uniref:AsIV-cont00077-ORF1 n=1 Tax=Apophua simplicipes ichnovirus TaxID=1329648 RepID=S5DML6_9VIRU|nr:AsIV-cont00077-ORF1 [Apophua simplicipes ichnovirus]
MSSSNSKIWEKLSNQIQMCNDYLKKFRNREMLDECRRKDLVECQLEKSKVIALLQDSVKNYQSVPPSVLKIYFDL